MSTEIPSRLLTPANTESTAVSRSSSLRRNSGELPRRLKHSIAEILGQSSSDESESSQMNPLELLARVAGDAEAEDELLESILKTVTYIAKLPTPQKTPTLVDLVSDDDDCVIIEETSVSAKKRKATSREITKNANDSGSSKDSKNTKGSKRSGDSKSSKETSPKIARKSTSEETSVLLGQIAGRNIRMKMMA